MQCAPTCCVFSDVNRITRSILITHGHTTRFKALFDPCACQSSSPPLRRGRINTVYAAAAVT